jgi:hypothetical protein
MRRPALFVLILTSIAFAFLTSAQNPPRQPVVSIPDGGARRSMESIFIPPKTGAPFSLILAAEWSRSLGNGGTFTLANERRIVRDSNGRIYQERWFLVPKGGNAKSSMNVFQITDPEQHTWYNCEPATKVCELLPYHLTTQQTYLPAIGTSGPLPNGIGFREHLDLGLGSSQGEETHGYRESTTINIGVMGNDRPMISTREFWYSARLGINLSSRVDDPETGKQIFTVKELSTAEPEASLFEVSADYKILNHLNEQTDGR